MRLLALLLLAAVPPICFGSPTVEPPAAQTWEARGAKLRARLRAITVADGISKPEADLIARCYFHKHVGCGAYLGIRDGGAYWIIEGAVGFGGMPVEGFHIDKRSGKITAGLVASLREDEATGKLTLSHISIGPSYASPFEILP